MIARQRRRPQGDPTIALINIVFLMLIFFIVAGTLAKAPEKGIEFVTSDTFECCAPPDAVAISATGELMFGGEHYASTRQYLAAATPIGKTLQILPDRRLPARELLRILTELRAGGAQKILLLSQDNRS